MRYLAASLIIVLIIGSNSLAALPFSALRGTFPAPSQAFTETTTFFDDFESYAVDTFPSQGGWQLPAGADPRNEFVSNGSAYSGSKSLQLYGLLPVALALTYRTVDTVGATQFGYESAVYIARMDPQATVEMEFWNTMQDRPSCGRCTWGEVFFSSEDMRISTSGHNGTYDLGALQLGTWYLVKTILDEGSNTFSVWINGALKVEDVTITYPGIERLNAIIMRSAAANVYFDNVRIFTLTPSTTTTTTTVVDGTLRGTLVAVALIAVVIVGGALIAMRRMHVRRHRAKELEPANVKPCVRCNVELPLDAKFCDSCGAEQA